MIYFNIANSVSRILALSSHSVRPLSVVRCPCVIKRDIRPYLHYMTFQTTQTKYFLKAYDVHYPLTHQHSLVTQIQIHKYTNTQIHKYTNTVLVKVTDMPNICYIFAKVMVHGSQKQCSRVSDVQIHKYKNTNTQIHFFHSCRYV